MNGLSDQDLKTIIARRDRRFDGRFYFGVRTTRIYCRPVCPARPKPENIRLFRSPTEAESQGFRPCKRCRPDASPGSKLFDGTQSTVARALRLIEERAGAALDVPTLAAKLGVTDRHVRRLFDEQLGASPVEILVTQRLHFAKQLVEESALPVTEIAFASGFKSLRRFNEAFRERYHQPPTAMRGKRASAADTDLRLRLPIRAPYDWATTLGYLAKHETFGVERIGRDEYVRYVPRSRGFGVVRVARAARGDHLAVTLVGVPLRDARFVLSRVRRLFDTDHNPADLPAAGGVDARGIRVPGAFDPFETAVGVILGQLVSIECARANVKKLVERFGRPLGEADGLPVLAYPTPATLADADVASIGLPKARGAAVNALAAAIRDGAIDFVAHEDFAATEAKLLALKGIGPWSASMIAMRCLGHPDAFPAGDLIVRRALELGLANDTAWASSRAYLAHCLWRDHAVTLSNMHRQRKETT